MEELLKRLVLLEKTRDAYNFGTEKFDALLKEEQDEEIAINYLAQIVVEIVLDPKKD